MRGEGGKCERVGTEVPERSKGNEGGGGEAARMMTSKRRYLNQFGITGVS